MLRSEGAAAHALELPWKPSAGPTTLSELDRSPPLLVKRKLPGLSGLHSYSSWARAAEGSHADLARGGPQAGLTMQEHIEATMLRSGWIRMSNRSDPLLQYWLNIHTYETMPIGRVPEQGERAASRGVRYP